MDIWWQKIKKPLLVVGIIIACVLVVGLVVELIVAITSGHLWYLDQTWDWTGFKEGTNLIKITSTPKTIYSVSVEQPYKTLWDWLGLLAVLAIPLVVALGAAWFTRQQGKVSERENKDNQRDKLLQNYIDKISELLLSEQLVERTADGILNPKYSHACNVARIRTITVLAQLDARRVGYVFAFLRQAKLMSATSNSSVVSLDHADLQRVQWEDAYLSYSNLSEANLSEANLYNADLRGVNFIKTLLVNADLRRAKLKGANLTGANLDQANLSGANLSGAKYNKKEIQRKDDQGNPVMIESTKWPQGFDPSDAKRELIRVDN